MPQRWKEWYDRPSGMREVLRLMLPLVVSTSSWTILQFTDRLFLLWYSPDSLAASLPAGMLAFAVICFPLGVVSYANAFVAQYAGARRPRQIGPVVWQAVFIAAAFTPAAMATNLLAPWFFAQWDHAAEVVELEKTYFCIMNYGAGAMLFSAALSCFFTGRGHTKVVMIVDMSAAMLNVVLDYAWIFGVWGFPEWGIAGAAWATVVSLWAKTVVYFLLFLRPAAQSEFATLLGARWNLPLARRLLRYATPNGVQFMIEITGFTVFVFLLGRLGTLELTSTNLAFNINGLAFMPVYGAGMAATTLVGQRLGENRPELAARATWTSFSLAATYMATWALIYVLLPDVILSLHGQDMDHAKFVELRDMTVLLLRFVAFYCMFDAMYAVFGGAIKGAGDTRFVMWTASLWAAIAVSATWAGLKWGRFGLIACWVTVTLWICALSVTYLLRFLGGKWRTMRVIEPEIEEPIAEEAMDVAPECA